MCLGYKDHLSTMGMKGRAKDQEFSVSKKQKGKVIRMHGKEEEGIIPLMFVIKVLVFLPRNQGNKRNYKEIKKEKFLCALCNETGELCCNVL